MADFHSPEQRDFDMASRKPKCVIYARFSPRPEKALEDCKSIGVQIQACRDYAEAQGYSVEAVYTDESKSRNDMDREGIFDAIRRIYRSWVVVAYSPDRIGAGMASAVIEHDIIRRGGRIEYAVGDINGDEPEKKLMRGMLSVIAEFEREMIGRRTSAGMKYRQANGERMTHAEKLPFGKMIDPIDPNRMIACPDEVQAIRAMRRWYKDGVTVADIVRKLNKSEFKPRGKAWHRNTVQRILDRSSTKPSPK